MYTIHIVYCSCKANTRVSPTRPTPDRKQNDPKNYITPMAKNKAGSESVWSQFGGVTEVYRYHKIFDEVRLLETIIVLLCGRIVNDGGIYCVHLRLNIASDNGAVWLVQVNDLKLCMGVCGAFVYKCSRLMIIMYMIV